MGTASVVVDRFAESGEFAASKVLVVGREFAVSKVGRQFGVCLPPRRWPRLLAGSSSLVVAAGRQGRTVGSSSHCTAAEGEGEGRMAGGT